MSGKAHLSFHEWVGDGSTTEFTFTFDYLAKNHVFVYVDDEQLTLVTDGGDLGDKDWKWDGEKKFKIGKAPENGVKVRAQRDTPDKNQIVRWEDGSYLVSVDLNTSDLQWLYLIQELEEGLDREGIVEKIIVGKPIIIDESDPDRPELTIDLITGAMATKNPKDPSWDTDEKLSTPAAQIRLFQNLIGDGKNYPGNGNQGFEGKLRIDNTGDSVKLFFWHNGKWNEIKLATDLRWIAEKDGGTIASDTGKDAKLTIVTEEKAGLMGPLDKKKLDGIGEGGELNVQSDWDQTDNSKDDFIRNKPTITENNDGDITNVRVDLGATTASEGVTITNSKGNDANIPAATQDKAGVLTADDKKKLDNLSGTDLGQKDRTAENLTITSSSGEDTILPFATSELAGILTAEDKERIDAVGQVLLFQGVVDLTSSENIPTPEQGGDRGFTWVNDNGEEEGAQEISNEWAAVIRNLDEGDTVSPGDFVIWTGGDTNDFLHLANAMVPTNLTVDNITENTIDVASSTGADATLPAATQESAGVMTAADKTKLDGIGENAGKTDLKWVGKGEESGVVESSTGTDATIPAVTDDQAGLMPAGAKKKLDGITAGATKTDLNYTAAADKGTITNSGGNNADIPLATGDNAGLLAPGMKTKIDGIDAGAEQNVQSDWNQTVDTLDDFIKNKPQIPDNIVESVDGRTGVVTLSDLYVPMDISKLDELE